MYALSSEERHELGLKGAKHVENNYNFNQFGEKWVNLMSKIYEQHGSWETRKGHNGIVFKEVA
jgi:hypothetical protein